MFYPCFKGKTALITGGTRGIGKETARLLASSGCSLSLVYRHDRRSAESTESEILALGVEVQLIQANLAEEESVSRIIDEVRTRFGRLDYFVSNAVFGVLKPIGEFTARRFDAAMDTNARAYLLLAQAAADLMVPPGTVTEPDVPIPAGKRMVALTSLGADKIIPGYAAIGASKAAIETLTRYLAAELAPRGIGVNAVSGGLVKTDSMKAFKDDAEWVEDRIAKTPMGRIGEAEDIARVVVWLLSDQAAWITGQTIVADGGLSLV